MENNEIYANKVINEIEDLQKELNTLKIKVSAYRQNKELILSLLADSGNKINETIMSWANVYYQMMKEHETIKNEVR